MIKKKRKGSKDFYLKFYFNDFANDPKVKDCKAPSVGVYIFLMCLFCNTKPRGKYRVKHDDIKQIAELLPQQNVQQSMQQYVQHIPTICRTFAEYFVRHLPYTEKVIAAGLEDLMINDVMYCEGEFLCQKRMVRDAEISDKRSESGKKGAAATNKKKDDLPQQKNGFAENLLNDLPQQKNQQNPNYNSDYNYNSDLVEDKGVSNNTSGGTGEEISGGKEEEPEKINFNLHTLPPKKKLELTQLDLQILQPRGQKFKDAWLEWINYLYEEHGKELKSMFAINAAIEDLLQKAKMKEPKAIEIIKLCISKRWKNFFTEDEKSNQNNTNGQTKNLTEDIDAQIAAETDPEKKQALRKKKYAHSFKK